MAIPLDDKSVDSRVPTRTATTSLLEPDANELRIEPATGFIGAIVSGTDLRRDQPESTRRRLIQALHEHGVLFFFFEEPIDDDVHKRIARVFGELHRFPEDSLPDPEIVELNSGTQPTKYYRTDHWHTDASFDERPPLATLLRDITLPSVGGDTMWSSMYAAYESLSSRFQRLLDDAEAVHSTAVIKSLFHKNADPAVFSKTIEATHPVVITDPVTSRRALYVNSNYTSHLVGFTQTESDRLLGMLFDQVTTPEFHVRLRWQPNTLAVWHERVTQHRAVVDFTECRVLRRVTVVGDRPS